MDTDPHGMSAVADDLDAHALIGPDATCSRLPSRQIDGAISGLIDRATALRGHSRSRDSREPTQPPAPPLPLLSTSPRIRLDPRGRQELEQRLRGGQIRDTRTSREPPIDRRKDVPRDLRSIFCQRQPSKAERGS
jgi:hypothetical protein